MSDGQAVATFGGGCFWCLEPIFSDVVGVTSVVSGYSGGVLENPTYEQVTTGTTGHAEVVQIHFDPRVVKYHDLLEIFFSIHDPTTLNRQGADVGTQYRSIILVHDSEQEKLAETMIDGFNAEGVYPSRIVSQVKLFETFYPAEEYHQEYFTKNPYQGYCRVVIAPKVAKFRKQNRFQLRSRQAQDPASA